MTKIEVTHTPEGDFANQIRTLFCKETCRKCHDGRNPLTETNFNALLDAVAQDAFDAGRKFQKVHPEIEL